MVVVNSDSTDHNNQRRRKWLWPFLLGLILGALIGGLSAYIAYKDDSGASHSHNNTSGSSEKSNENTPPTALNNEQRADVSRYAQLLVEASREGVDVPSDEAAAAQEALNDASMAFVSTLSEAKLLNSDANKDDLQDLVTAVNDSFLEYAGTAREGDNHENVDDAVNRLVDNLKQNAKLKNESQFSAAMVSFKNTVLESVRDFVNDDFAASYSKETQAADELQKIVDNMKAQ